MTCPRCSYEWCWSCGLQVDHWTHRFADNPFGCGFVATNGCDLMKKFLMFILGLILIPFVFICLPIFVGIGYGLGGTYIIYMAFNMKVDNWYGIIIKIILIVLSFPGAAIAFVFCSAAGVFVSGLGVLAIIPAIILHAYLFARSVIWWRKNLRNTS